MRVLVLVNSIIKKTQPDFYIIKLFIFAFKNNKSNNFRKEVKIMTYKKPKVLAYSTEQMAECRPNSKPSGRPCNPPKPSGR